MQPIIIQLLQISDDQAAGAFIVKARRGELIMPSISLSIVPLWENDV